MTARQNLDVIRAVLGPQNFGTHPDEREQSSLEDVYVKISEAEVVLADLAILAGRHLPTSLARKAERALSTLIELRHAVMPAADSKGPF